MSQVLKLEAEYITVAELCCYLCSIFDKLYAYRKLGQKQERWVALFEEKFCKNNSKENGINREMWRLWMEGEQNS